MFEAGFDTIVRALRMERSDRAVRLSLRALSLVE